MQGSRKDISPERQGAGPASATGVPAPSFFRALFQLVVILLLAGGLLSHPISAQCGEQTGVPLLDQALEAVAMNRGDIFIRPDLSPDLSSLSRFRDWMSEPLRAPARAQEEARRLLGAADRASSLFRALASPGDVPPSGALPLRRYDPDPLPRDLPEGMRKALHILLDALFTARKALEDLRDGIPPEELALIREVLYPDWIDGRDPKVEPGQYTRDEDLRRALLAADMVDRRVIFQAALTLFEAVDRAGFLLTEKSFRPEGLSSFSFMTDMGLVEIGGTGPDVHQRDAALILDLGGNDVYRGRVASGREWKCALVLDLGGDDVYLGDDMTQAFGFWGVGILRDLGGDDLYRSGSGAQGAGLFGAGILLDEGGSDTYEGREFVQAASAWGWGCLIDLGGEDVYRCRIAGQAYSEVLGVSCLADSGGNDKYISGEGAPDPREQDMNKSFSQGFAMGMRGSAAGGFAMLADGSGNDIYQCGYFGQGASYWMGIGILYDEEGKDTYIARRYAQGAGIHFSLGLLLDAGGDDHTFSWGVSQGCGHDYGIGILVNEEGNDTYVSDWLSMGASEANGIGILTDNSGDDRYDTRTGMAVGRLTESRRAGGIGLFMDAGGRDAYSGKGGDNDLWTSNRWGVGIDGEAGGMSGLRILPAEPPPPLSEEALEERAEETRRLSGIFKKAGTLPLPEGLEAMLSIVSHWGFDEETPRRAREEILRLDPERSVPAMVGLLGTPGVMAHLFMEDFFRVHACRAIPLLAARAGHPDPLVRARALRLLGRLRDTRTLDQCLTALGSPSWRVRSAAARAAGEILDRGRLENLIPMRGKFEEALKENDPKFLVDYLKGKEKGPMAVSVLARALPMDYETFSRLEEAPAQGKEGPGNEDLARFLFRHLPETLPVLQRWIRDIEHSGPAAQRIMPLLQDPDPAVIGAAAYTLGQLRHLPAVPSLTALLEGSHLWIRDAAVLSLALFGDDAVRPLSLTVKEGTPSSRILALEALGAIGSTGAKEVVREYLSDPDMNVRRAAGRALSNIR